MKSLLIALLKVTLRFLFKVLVFIFLAILGILIGVLILNI